MLGVTCEDEKRLSIGEANGQHGSTTDRSGSVSPAPAEGRRKSSVWARLRKPSKPKAEAIARTFEKELLIAKLRRGCKAAVPPEEEECSIEDAPFYVYKAAREGLLPELERIGRRFPGRLSEADEKGLAPVHHAAEHRRLDVLRFLAAQGVGLDAADGAGDAALHRAVQAGAVEVVRELLVLGAKGDLRNAASLAPIHLAALEDRPEVIDEMAKHPGRVDFNAATHNGQNALHLACKDDHFRSVQSLLDGGCALCTSCNFGLYPIHVAAKAAAHRSMELRTQVILVAAEAKGYTRGMVLSFVSAEAQSPLHAAVVGGDVEAVQACLQHGAHIDARQDDQATAVHLAANQGLVEVLDLMLRHYEAESPEHSALDLLHARDVLGLTPLHRAAMFDHPAVVEWLIGQGSDVNLVCSAGRSALLMAAEKGGLRSVQILLQAGASLAVRDSSNRNVLHHLISHGPRFQALLPCVIGKEAELLHSRDAEGCTPLHLVSRQGHVGLLDTLLKLGAKSNARDLTDQSPLHFAARFGRVRTLTRLLEASASSVINDTDGAGNTPLHVASANGQTDVIHLLLSRGALVNKNYAAKTPLHLAAERGCSAAVALLLAFHANLLDVAEREGNSALHLAAAQDNADVVAELLTAGAAYGTNREGLYPLDLVIEARAVRSAIAVVQHSRWSEILGTRSKLYGCPLLGFVQHMPQVEKLVLDRFIDSPDLDPTHPDFFVNYNFAFMGPSVEEQREAAREGQRNMALLGVRRMVEFGRVDLLSHPVCIKFLDMKWKAYGSTLFYVGLAVYVLFLFNLSYVTVRMRKPIADAGLFFGTNDSLFGTNGSATESWFHYGRPVRGCPFAPWFLFIYCILNIVKEFVQMYQQGLAYVMDPINYDEWTLYLATLGFVTPMALWGVEGSWACAAVAVLVAWLNFFLYFQRTPSVGLYVVMFLQIFYTVIRVALVFSTIFIGFGLAFSVLFAGKAERGFGDVSIAVLHTVMMMMGEWDFQRLVVDSWSGRDLALPFPLLTIGLLLLFILLVPILFINLLIGLAVGDIDNVQRHARLKRLAMQVEYQAQMEEKMPWWVLSRVDRRSVRVYPNRRSHGLCCMRPCHWLAELLSGGGRGEAEPLGVAAKTPDALGAQSAEAAQEVRRLKAQLERQEDMLRMILKKMDISDEADEPRHTTGRNGFA